MRKKQVRDSIKEYIKNLDPVQIHFKDQISHFALRIAMCDSQDRDWFINSEIQLLKYRLVGKEDTNFYKNNQNFYGEEVSEEEFQSLKNHLMVIVKKNLEKGEKNPEKYLVHTNFVKVPFEQIPNLMVTKQTAIYKGYGYIYKKQAFELFATSFSSFINTALDRVKMDKDRIKQSFPEIIEFFSTLPLHANRGLQRNINYGEIRKEEVLPLSKVSFPMCMRTMHDSLVQTGKLKHEGRLQFSTFLKSIGLPFTEAIVYWKQAFNRRVSSTEFDKEYAYTLRHTYGLEGKAVSYSPYSCNKIIAKVPSASDQVHGCPYLWSVEKLQEKLLEIGTDPLQVDEILRAARLQPNAACTKHFEFLHPNNRFIIQNIIHPNQFYENSRKYHKKKKEEEDDKSKTDQDNSSQ
eukprot:gene9101-11152_t